MGDVELSKKEGNKESVVIINSGDGEGKHMPESLEDEKTAADK